MGAQADVFAEVAPLIESVVDGYNACILAYGQTGRCGLSDRMSVVVGMSM